MPLLVVKVDILFLFGEFFILDELFTGEIKNFTEGRLLLIPSYS